MKTQFGIRTQLSTNNYPLITYLTVGNPKNKKGQNNTKPLNSKIIINSIKSGEKPAYDKANRGYLHQF
ncbi:hypothetical protein JT359_15075 [Candidatus Poribacteria bacterium]|nr:hypothetical protein [Candidatus Poribacteria bacterium]